MEKQSVALMCLAVLLATFSVTQGQGVTLTLGVGAKTYPGKKKKIPDKLRPRSVVREL